MRIGYARVSTADQDAGLEAQERDLKVAGCEKLFTEKVSGTSLNRPQLGNALEFMREGDVLVITKPDRLARNTRDLLAIIEAVEAKKCSTIIMSMGGGTLDTANPTSRLMLTMLAAVAQFERDIMIERQREGIAKAKQAGKFKGRAPIDSSKVAQARALIAQGQSVVEASRATGIGRSTLYRITKDA